MGPRTAEFECRGAATYSKRHGISVNSGSSALYLAMEALDLPSGSEVITPARRCEAQAQFFGRYSEWIDLPRFSRGVDSVWFAFPLVVREEAPFSRRDLQSFLERRNIQTRAVLTGNITRQPGFRDIPMRIDPAGLANTDRVMEQGVLVAAHHGSTDRVFAYLHASFEEFARRY